MSTPLENPTFVGDDGKSSVRKNRFVEPHLYVNNESVSLVAERDTWGKGIEFLMSCIAMSVGLGNVWRFPFTALDNGGGAFLIPYLVVLFLVGKPIYYLEMIIGQFSSRGSVKVFAMKGIGIAQAYMVFLLATYYVSICALLAYYMAESFRDPLPWSYCRPEWGSNCINSSFSDISSIETVQGSKLANNSLNNLTTSENLLRNTATNRTITSSELFFVHDVLREKENINDGIGIPNWELVLGLFVSWVCAFSIVHRGVKSSGKASYFLAIFPYVIMFVLLIRAVTLPGSVKGIIYFIKPNWSKILEPTVWYAAVTQCFYSLCICFGAIVSYSSYNKFTHNVYRDATIVTSLDTCTSLLAGFTIFGILGHLAHELGTDDIGSVVKGGAGLAFISYPEVIAKFKKLPQIFSVLFFLMLFVLGIGSNVAMISAMNAALSDTFPKIKHWQSSLGIAVISFVIGLAYVTPGGQFILTLVDYFGVSMIALILGIAELYALSWIYGVDRLCKDAEFMTGRKVGLYWRWCWGIITPLIMTIILIYFFATYTSLTYNNTTYPTSAYAVGWTLTCIGISQIPIWMIVAVIRSPSNSWSEKIRCAFKPSKDWGPRDLSIRDQYNNEIENESIHSLSCWETLKKNLFGSVFQQLQCTETLQIQRQTNRII